MPTKVIKLADLKNAIDKIFESMESEGLNEIRLEHDYYHSLGQSDRFMSSESKPAPEILLGQLYDDWEFLEKMLNDDGACFPMLMHVSPLLDYIVYRGYDMNKELKKVN